VAFAAVLIVVQVSVLAAVVVAYGRNNRSTAPTHAPVALPPVLERPLPRDNAAALAGSNRPEGAPGSSTGVNGSNAPGAAVPGGNAPGAASSSVPTSNRPSGWVSGYRSDSPAGANAPSDPLPPTHPGPGTGNLPAQPAPAPAAAPGVVDAAFGQYLNWLQGAERDRINLRRAGGAGDLFYSFNAGPDALLEPWMQDPEQRQQAYTRMAEHSRLAGILAQNSIRARPPIPMGFGNFDANYGLALAEEAKALERMAVAVGSGDPQRILPALRDGNRDILARLNGAQGELEAVFRARGARPPLTLAGASATTTR
jgi:hypothetical protein